ncbi:MAG TPA: DUF1203 domain-containing protein [Vicinamibacterales bacterium]|jgi:hypothetical protein
MFQISALPRRDFDEWLALDDQQLAARGARRCMADRKPGFPCRVSLADAEPGERVILLPFCHQPADSPYKAFGPIFVRETAATAVVPPGTVPDLLRSRLLSVRAYDAAHLMTEAEVVEGRELEPLIARLFERSSVAYAHIHFARPGCYACRVDRVAAVRG